MPNAAKQKTSNANNEAIGSVTYVTLPDEYVNSGSSVNNPPMHIAMETKHSPSCFPILPSLKFIIPP